MKKFFIVLSFLLICIPSVVNAQPKAIGGRIGAFGLEASYQHSVAAGNNGFANFLEADLALSLPVFDSGFGAVATGLYGFVFARPQWTDEGEWEWHAGPGVSIGYSNGFVFGVCGEVGLTYTFDFGLQLGASFRPTFGLRAWGNDVDVNSEGNVRHTDVAFWKAGLYGGLVPSLSVRYAF